MWNMFPCSLWNSSYSLKNWHHVWKPSVWWTLQKQGHTAVHRNTFTHIAPKYIEIPKQIINWWFGKIIPHLLRTFLQLLSLSTWLRTFHRLSWRDMTESWQPTAKRLCFDGDQNVVNSNARIFMEKRGLIQLWRKYLSYYIYIYILRKKSELSRIFVHVFPIPDPCELEFKTYFFRCLWICPTKTCLDVLISGSFYWNWHVWNKKSPKTQRICGGSRCFALDSYKNRDKIYQNGSLIVSEISQLVKLFFSKVQELNQNDQ